MGGFLFLECAYKVQSNFASFRVLVLVEVFNLSLEDRLVLIHHWILTLLNEKYMPMLGGIKDLKERLTIHCKQIDGSKQNQSFKFTPNKVQFFPFSCQVRFVISYHKLRESHESMIKTWLCIFSHLTKFQLGEVSRTLHCCWIDNESVINMLDC